MLTSRLLETNDAGYTKYRRIMPQNIKWPRKTRDIHSHHFDSTIWDDFQFRDDDIIIATYAKSGTTWMQQIIAQLLFEGDPDLSVAEMSPWLDLRVPPEEVKLPLVEEQTHGRFIKPHLPVNALHFSPEAKSTRKRNLASSAPAGSHTAGIFKTTPNSPFERMKSVSNLSTVSAGQDVRCESRLG